MIANLFLRYFNLKPDINKTMKHQLIIVCLIGISLHCIGQNAVKAKNNAQKTSKETKGKAIDQATLKCYYLFSKKKEGASKPYRQDTLALDIGAKTSRFYDPARLGRDSIVAERINNMQNISEDIKRITVLKGEDAKDLSDMQGTVTSNSNQGESYQIYKDRVANQVKVIDQTTVARDIFLYEDQIGSLPWQISNETETILSYSCQKATLHFRGRDYIAWFASDIPVSDGPWKFMGLPGLILKVEDTQQLFSFTLVGLEKYKKPVPLIFNDNGTIKCSRSDFESLKKKQSSGTQYNFSGGNVIIAEIPGIYDYAPMELE